MALAESIDEEKWVNTRKGGRPVNSVNAATLTQLTALWQAAFVEFKYYALTKTAADSYINAHPELDLEREDINGFPNACNLIKRADVQTLVSITRTPTP
jgi:hypothetical protein